MHVTITKEEVQKMSVRATKTRTGLPVWLVEVKRDRGAFHRRRFLDRKKYLKVDALNIERALVREYEALKKGGHCSDINHHPGVFDGGDVPFSTYARRFLELLDANSSDFPNKKRNVEVHLIPHFRTTPLANVSTLMIDELRSKLQNEPIRRRSGKRSPKTVNNILTTLSTLLKRAHDHELIDRLPKVRRMSVPKVDADYLYGDEVVALVRAVPKQWRPLVQTALYTGLRRGELYELRWFDLRLDGPSPHVRVARAAVVGATVADYRVKLPKSGKARTVPLKKEIVEILRRHKPADAKRNDLVFTESEGGYLLPKTFYNEVVNAGDEAVGRHVKPHMLRHTFASNAYAQGVPPQVLQQWLGHVDIKTTQRYAHLRPGAGSDLIELLSFEAV